MDLEMLTTFNARERPLADWIKLCENADSRLKFRTVSKPEGSVMSILEFVFEDQNGQPTVIPAGSMESMYSMAVSS